MPKAVKVVVFDEHTQVYPVDLAEYVWHVWRADGPIAEIQFASGPVDVQTPCRAVIQDCPDFISIERPDGHEQVFEDDRPSDLPSLPDDLPQVLDEIADGIDEDARWVDSSKVAADVRTAARFIRSFQRSSR